MIRKEGGVVIGKRGPSAEAVADDGDGTIVSDEMEGADGFDDVRGAIVDGVREWSGTGTFAGTITGVGTIAGTIRISGGLEVELGPAMTAQIEEECGGVVGLLREFLGQRAEVLAAPQQAVQEHYHSSTPMTVVVVVTVTALVGMAMLFMWVAGYDFAVHDPFVVQNRILELLARCNGRCTTGTSQLPHSSVLCHVHLEIEGAHMDMDASNTQSNTLK